MRIDLAPGEDIATASRAARGDSLVIVIAAGRDPLALAMAEAAVGPLAVERAPATRLNAVVAAADRDSYPGAVEAAVAFLESATSTTGQVLRLS